MSIASLQKLESKLGINNISYIPRLRDITVDEFTQTYLSNGAPVILEQKLSDRSAFQRWTPQFFKEQYSDMMFDAQVMLPKVGSLGFLKLGDHSCKMPLNKVLDIWKSKGRLVKL